MRIGITEPNISVQKTASIPMLVLVCEEAYRAARGGVERMLALNAMHMKEHSTLLYLANSLNPSCTTIVRCSKEGTISPASWRCTPMRSCRINGRTITTISISTCFTFTGIIR